MATLQSGLLARAKGPALHRCACVILLTAACNSPESNASEDGVVERFAAQKQALEVGEWPLEALVATNSIQFEDRATFEGDVAVTQAATGAVLSSGTELVIGPDAVLTGSVAADGVVVRERSVVTGNADYNSLAGSGTIQGTAASPLSLPLPLAVPQLPSIAPGFQNVQLSNSAQQTLPAGQYGAVSLANGS